MKIAAWFSLGLLLCATSFAGTITGTVSARGAAPKSGDAGGAYQSRRYKFVEKMDYDKLTDFVIYLDEPLAAVSDTNKPTVAVTTQKNATFEPHVLVIAAGTDVKWPNDDDIYHNVFSMSDPKVFDLGLYQQERVPVVNFEKPGRIDVFCSIHSQMHCIIFVTPNPFFAKADAGKKFVIKNVPAGTYKLRAWHERLPSQMKEIIVPEDGEVKVDFILGLGELPKY